MEDEDNKVVVKQKVLAIAAYGSCWALIHLLYAVDLLPNVLDEAEGNYSYHRDIVDRLMKGLHERG